MRLYLLIGLLLAVVAMMVQEGDSWPRIRIRLPRIRIRVRRVLGRVVNFCKSHPITCYKVGKAAVVAVGDENKLQVMMNDQDGDGKMTLHEMEDEDLFEELDANDDGFVDQKELDNLQEHFNMITALTQGQSSDDDQLDDELDEKELAELKDLLSNQP
ncbi:uncharacterized protein LOC106181207 isoform X1 [Lingula anatina]|uniref:Uncharacterized protein LOC106181207 isoform X1 n=2 Tax=Lingula anatina TaxID=7574 RepID=A0A1S3KFH2_LINAN|nr:uncharacterized protein LOC106181207 isoform X1 [Lingula anatina]XP_023933254.1 uncharacterized protein LOC106181207 isoform X1 [Lingula anatina]|eukprot:XP_013420986.1 uncharacterized protein LOC106181207 isoform X1 [Lingula anatina]